MDKQLHIVMFPWLAFGHIIPFLELSKLIARKGHKISFISTKRNIDRLPELPPNLAPLMTFVKLTLPHVKELPENAEATKDVPASHVRYLKQAFDGLEYELTRFLELESPDWVIYDFAPFWLPPIAARLGIARAFFCVFNAWFVALLGPSSEALLQHSHEQSKPEDLIAPPEWVPFPTNVSYRLYEVNKIRSAAKHNASDVSDMFRCGSIIIGSEAILIRHCMKFEPQWLCLIEKLHKKLVLPVGLMPPSLQERKDEKDETWLPIKEWLDCQSKQSVVYIALGTEVIPSQDDLTELALGLEVSKLPFFWALRKTPGSTEVDSVELPEGFLERTRGHGLVWTSWAPQLKILDHESVGGFMTHCGWNSVIEGLMFGQPLIMLPFLADQGLNARVLTDKKVGIEVPRNEQDGSFSRNSVAESLTSVMVRDEGRHKRDKAEEISAIFRDQYQNNLYTDDLVEFLMTHKSFFPCASNLLQVVYNIINRL